MQLLLRLSVFPLNTLGFSELGLVGLHHIVLQLSAHTSCTSPSKCYLLSATPRWTRKSAILGLSVLCFFIGPCWWVDIKWLLAEVLVVEGLLVLLLAVTLLGSACLFGNECLLLGGLIVLVDLIVLIGLLGCFLAKACGVGNASRRHQQMLLVNRLAAWGTSTRWLHAVLVAILPTHRCQVSVLVVTACVVFRGRVRL